MNRRGFLGMLGALVPLSGAVAAAPLAPPMVFDGIPMATALTELADRVGAAVVTSHPFGTPDAIARAVEEALMRGMRHRGSRF